MAEKQTRDKIITAARHLFSTKGFRGATTAEIARKAGVAEGTIYTYFNTKKDLLMECVIPYLEELVENLGSNVGDIKDLRGLTVCSVEMRLKTYEKHHETIRIMLGELPYSSEMVDLFLSLFEKQSKKISGYMAKVEGMEQVVRSRNYCLFGLGHILSLWFYINLKKTEGGRGLKSEHPFFNISEEHLSEDLADFFLYGIIGDPPREGAT